MTDQTKQQVEAERAEAYETAGEWGAVAADEIAAPAGEEGPGADAPETDEHEARDFDNGTIEYEAAAETMQKLDANAIGMDNAEFVDTDEVENKYQI